MFKLNMFVLAYFIASFASAIGLNPIRIEATFELYDEGSTTISFSPKSVNGNNAPLLFAQLIMNQPFLGPDQTGTIKIDLKDKGPVREEAILKLLKFYLGYPLIETEDSSDIPFLIEHAKRFNLSLAGEEILKSIDKIMKVIKKPGSSVRFSRIAVSMFNAAFDENGNYLDGDIWYVQLYKEFYLLLEADHKYCHKIERILEVITNAQRKKFNDFKSRSKAIQIHVEN